MKKNHSRDFACKTAKLVVCHLSEKSYQKISFSTRHQGVNDIFALKSSVFIFRLSKTWRHYSEDITVSSCSQYYTWRNDLSLYYHIILAIMIIMFIYSGTVFIWDPWILNCHPPMSFVPFASPWAAYQNPKVSNDTNALKMKIIAILSMPWITFKRAGLSIVQSGKWRS